MFRHPDLELVVAAEAWSESEHEIRRRIQILDRIGRLGTVSAEKAVADALDFLANAVRVVASDVFANRMADAARRVPRDTEDAPTVALALALDCGIWTSDRDFFGCGVPVWTTETLLLHLAGTD